MKGPYLWLAVTVVAILIGWLFFRRSDERPVPAVLRRGKPLPDFQAVDERGNPVRSTQLHGAPAVLLFVRGTWCPFCSAQVEALTRHYKDIIDLGGRLILITPKPLETTRRVAEFFEVEFDFWLDDSLAVARQLGLVLQSGVPEEFSKEFGTDTVWPTAIVTDAAGIIVYVNLSRDLIERPDPLELLDAVRKAKDA